MVGSVIAIGGLGAWLFVFLKYLLLASLAVLFISFQMEVTLITSHFLYEKLEQ